MCCIFKKQVLRGHDTGRSCCCKVGKSGIYSAVLPASLIPFFMRILDETVFGRMALTSLFKLVIEEGCDALFLYLEDHIEAVDREDEVDREGKEEHHKEGFEH